MTFPEEVLDEIGYALHLAQEGEKHPSARVLRGFGGASVVEVIEPFDTDTYRAVYTVRFADAVYVLHAFKRKSHQGARTPDADMSVIRQRLKREEDAHKRGVR
ncbi:MAG TPA: type II toxin-antitoxin system RelE/ParE family toxin [Armatimonadota bacterium]